MRRLFVYVITGILLLNLLACVQPVAGEEVKSDKQRIANPSASQADLSELVKGNNAFAFDLYKQISADDKNLFYSPYSISTALAMVYAGARGATEQQMKQALHFNLSQERLHPSFNALDGELNKRGEGAKGKDSKGFRLNIVNAIWGQRDYTFLASFLDTLAENYGAGLRTLGFISSPEESRITINKWVSDQTEGRIKDLIPQGLIDRLTRLVLTNAIYFNAAWQYPFNKNATKEEPFHLITGGQVSVLMMRDTESFGYAEGTGYQTVELPYDGRELSMVIILPSQGQFKQFEDSMDAQVVSTIIGNLKSQRVDLTMPKFEFESSFSAKQALIKAGMVEAFTDNADFSRIEPKKELYITEILHKAFVSVDEEGTEAAAATAVIMGVTSVPAMTISVKIDRPFIFVIRDIETDALLFVGRVMNPGK